MEQAVDSSPEIASESESVSKSSDNFEEPESVLNEYKETIDNIRRKKVPTFKWDLHGEMQADFGKDPELVKKLYIRMNEALASLMQTIATTERDHMTSSLFSGSVDVERVGSSAGLCFFLATVIRSEGEGVGWLYNGLKLSLLGTAASYASLIENDRKYVNRTSRVYHFLNKVKTSGNHTLKESYAGIQTNDAFLYSIWEEEKSLQTTVAKNEEEDDWE
ncbi:hypothetical protein Tco_0483432 [Tanacetum coccineum]